MGVGNLGSALLGYTDFEKAGIRIVAAFDSSPAKVGTEGAWHAGLPHEPVRGPGPGSATSPSASSRSPPTGPSRSPRSWWAAVSRPSGTSRPITLDVPAEIIVENVELYASLAIFSRKLEERRKAKARAAL